MVIFDKMSEREAAKMFGLARETVRKMLRYAVPPDYRLQPLYQPKRIGLEQRIGFLRALAIGG